MTHLAAPQVSIEPYWVSIEAVRMAIQVDRGTIEVVLVVIALPSLSTKLDICPIESGHLIGDIRQSFREVFGV